MQKDLGARAQNRRAQQRPRHTRVEAAFRIDELVCPHGVACMESTHLRAAFCLRLRRHPFREPAEILGVLAATSLGEMSASHTPHPRRAMQSALRPAQVPATGNS